VFVAAHHRGAKGPFSVVIPWYSAVPALAQHAPDQSCHPLIWLRISQAFVNLGVAPEEALVQADDSDMEPDKGGTMLTFDFLKARFVKDSNGALATRLLLCHFAQFWKNLVCLK